MNPDTLIPLKNGSFDWGQISQAVEDESGGLVRAGVIRMPHGDHKGDKNSEQGFGMVHIHAKHPDHFTATTFETFVVDALTHFTSVHRGRAGKTLLFRSRQNRTVAVVRWSEKGYYTVTTVFRPKNPHMTAELLWKKEKTDERRTTPR